MAGKYPFTNSHSVREIYATRSVAKHNVSPPGCAIGTGVTKSVLWITPRKIGYHGNVP